MGPRGELWKKHHSQRRFQLGMRPGEKPWTSKRPRRRLRGIQGGLKSTSKRVLDLIDLGFGAYTRHREEMELPLEDKPGWFLEVGQSAERAPWGASLPLCSQKVWIYHYGMDQVLSSRRLGGRAAAIVAGERCLPPTPDHLRAGLLLGGVGALASCRGPSQGWGGAGCACSCYAGCAYAEHRPAECPDLGEEACALQLLGSPLQCKDVS